MPVLIDSRGYINGRKSYSQYAQDHWVMDRLGWKRDGYFLDSGSADGAFLSNTFLMENEYGWTGICVEPDDRLFELCNRLRKCHVEHACLWSDNNGVNFHEDDLLGKVNPNGSKRKNSITIRDLLRKYDAPKVIDYWSLDVEGYEYPVLQWFPWDEYAVKIITVEHNNRNYMQYLLSLGYVHEYDNDCDDCFVRRDLL